MDQTIETDFNAFLAVQRSWLYQQACWRLGAERSAAEDVVQETLLAAWKGQGSLKAAPSRGWLAGILRHKIADHWRRVPPTDSDSFLECGGEPFDQAGHWAHASKGWGNPEALLETEGFWKVLELCSRIMPTAMYRVFVLREVDGCGVEEICSSLEISSSNCHVLLHRARLKLRGCVGEKWGRT